MTLPGNCVSFLTKAFQTSQGHPYSRDVLSPGMKFGLYTKGVHQIFLQTKRTTRIGCGVENNAMHTCSPSVVSNTFFGKIQFLSVLGLFAFL
jgi:hypothetical protein